MEKKSPNTDKEKNDLNMLFLVIDDDIAIAKNIENILRKQGYRNIASATDGQLAWNFLKKKKVDFIFLDWNIPKIHGMALLNRIRQEKKYQYTPIAVVSGYLKKQDFSLLDEFPLITKISKPFYLATIIGALKELTTEVEWYSTQMEVVSTLLDKIISGESNSYEPLINLLKNSPRKLPIALMAAKMLRNQGIYKDAESMLSWCLKDKPDNVQVLSELGKLYLKKGDYTKALDMMKKAQEHCPNNIDRLCDMGNAHMHLIQPEEAKNAFDHASTVDKNNTIARQGHKLAHEMISFISANPEMSTKVTFASILNAIGISQTKTGNYDDGIDHYQSAMSYVQDHEMQSKLCFNLGLCYLRWRKPDEAEPWFEKSLSFNPLFEKSKIRLDALHGKNKEIPEIDIEAIEKENLISLDLRDSIAEKQANVPTKGMIDIKKPAESSKPATPSSQKAAAPAAAVKDSTKQKEAAFTKSAEQEKPQAQKEPQKENIPTLQYLPEDEIIFDESAFDMRKIDETQTETAKFAQIEGNANKPPPIDLAGEKKSKSEKLKENMTEIGTKGELTREFPEMHLIYKIMLTDGIHVDSQIPGYIKHYYRYGPIIFRRGLNKAIVSRRVTANEIGHIFESIETMLNAS
ncbi:MAG: response regulator [Oligoflexales bacterium]|nr:response regulator [Oligoflexales bacterium]